MRFARFSVAVFLVCLLQSVNAQKHFITSFEGDRIAVKIFGTARNRVLAVSCPTDTIFLSDYTGTIISTHVIKSKFLQIIYIVRGGTGLQLHKTIVLVINKGRLLPALLINSYAYSFSPKRENSQLIDNEKLYQVKLKMIKDETKIKVIAVINEKQTSNSNPKANRTYNREAFFNFDTLHHIFFTKNIRLPKVITTENQVKLKVQETVPEIKLGDEAYYFIHRNWYHKGFQNVYYKDYYK